MKPAVALVPFAAALVLAGAGEAEVANVSRAYPASKQPAVAKTLAAATTVAVAVPSPPTLLKASPGNAVVSLAWSAPASDGGSAVTGYRLYRATSAGAEKLLTTLANVTSYTDSGLTNGLAYYYKVSAVNALGESGLSNELRAGPATVPSAPTLNGATAGDGSVALTWSKPASTGGTMITGYRVYRSGSSGTETLLTTLGSAATGYTDTAVTNGTAYYYEVSAVNDKGASALSNERSATPAAAAAPAPIYWGAYTEGRMTYNYLYGGTWSNGPWCDAGTGCPLPRFTANAGKAPSVEHWGMCWACDFDSQIAAKVVARGDIPAIDWSNDGSAADADVAAGKYDAQVTRVAQAMAAFGHPLFLLFDEEMNGSWYQYAPGVSGNTTASFVAMWRHVHDLFVQAGASNVTWVWVPNVDPANGMTPMGSVYPGDAYVDWTGLNGYNWGPAGGGWMSFDQVFHGSYATLLQIAPSKPIMIGEVASEEAGGDKAAWITDMLTSQLPQHYPQIKAMLWLNWRIPEKNQYWNWEIESSAASQAAFAQAIASPYYAPGGGFGTLPLGTKIRPLQ